MFGGDTPFSEDEEYHYSSDEDEMMFSPNSKDSLNRASSYGMDDDYEEYQYSDDDGSDTSGFTTPNQYNSVQSSDTSTSRGQKRTSTLGKRNNAEYRVIDEKELQGELDALVADVSQILEVPLPVSKVLLRQVGWQKEKLFENYLNDPEKCMKESGLEHYGKEPLKYVDGQEVECPICCELYPPSETFSMGCYHSFCNNCWKSYLTLKVGEGPLSVIATCPSHGCGEAITEDVFKKFVSDKDFEKYSRFLLRSFVDINKSYKWCPTPGCNKAISSSGGCFDVTCDCGCVFCIRCGEESHVPVSCEQLAMWHEKCRNESETANWILANTKKCPKCSVRIEKNQGCNHMTCRSCSYEFCWVCMDSWSKHGTGTGGYYKCNRYEAAEEAENADTDAARAKAELDRYLHYYQRYANHSEAGKFAERMRESTEQRMSELQGKDGNSTWMDVEFLNAATEQLIECRRVLKYTYVFGYYLPKGKEKDLFEYLQENLEKNTEHLTGLSESTLDKMNRSEIVNYTRVTERFLHNLLDGVEDGLTSNTSLLDTAVETS